MPYWDERFAEMARAYPDVTVDKQHIDILAANFGQSNRSYTQGDFNYDGAVNLADFNLLAGNFGQSLAPARATPFLSIGGAKTTTNDDTSDDTINDLLG